MAPRGKAIPLHIKREIAKHFAVNGFTRCSRKSAEKIYDDLSKSGKKLSR